MVDVHEELGSFSADELRAGGVNSAGLLGPLLPTPPGGQGAVEAATEHLKASGLLLYKAGDFRPAGSFGRCLRAVNGARAAVVGGPVDQAGKAVGPRRMVFGRLGLTDVVMDLLPQGDAYRARMLGAAQAACELAGYLLDTAGDLSTRRAFASVEAVNAQGPDSPPDRRRILVTTATGVISLSVDQGGASGTQVAPADASTLSSVLEALLVGRPLTL